jgi:hypothetical protein
MLADEYKAALAALGFTYSAFSLLTGIGDKSVRRYAHGDTIPLSVCLLIRLMMKHEVTPQDLSALS